MNSSWKITWPLTVKVYCPISFLLIQHQQSTFLADPKISWDTCVHFSRVKAYHKIKRKSFISKMKMMTTLPPTHFLHKYNHSWQTFLKLFFLCMLKTFLFWLFFKLRNSIFLLEWTTRMLFLPASILSIFNDAHSIKGGTWSALSLPTLHFLFPFVTFLYQRKEDYST